MEIGTVKIEKPIILAPMEDVTDTAFRIICKRLGADIVYTEFTSSEAIIRGIPRVMQKIKIKKSQLKIKLALYKEKCRGGHCECYLSGPKNIRRN